MTTEELSQARSLFWQCIDYFNETGDLTVIAELVLAMGASTRQENYHLSALELSLEKTAFMWLRKKNNKGVNRANEQKTLEEKLNIFIRSRSN